MSLLKLQEDQKDPDIERLRVRMQQVQEQLVLKTPLLHEALKDIHQTLQIHEELTHLMDDDDIEVLHKGFEIHKQHALIQKEEKAISKKSKKKLTNEDLNNL